MKGAGQDGSRNWVTIIASICADGSTLPPAVIFQGAGDIQSTWLQDFDTAKHECYFASTPSGFSNEDLGFHWLTRVFDKATKAKAGHGWRLLWVDGHNSHLNMRFFDWAIKERILLAIYPPHSTHRLQPLDVGLFSPLSTFYSQALDLWILRTHGIIGLQQKDFFNLFWPAFERAFTKKNVLVAWLKTGLSPFNSKIVLSQLDKYEPPRPQSSSSAGSVLSASDWRKFRTILRTEVNMAINTKVLKGMEQLHAENELLKFENTSLKETIKLQGKKGIRGKPLWEQIRADQEFKTLFLSPAKVDQARRIIEQKVQVEAAELTRKQQQNIDKAVAREVKQQQLQQRKAARAEAKIVREQQMAEKQACKQEALFQRKVDKQLKAEAISASKAARDKGKKSSQSQEQDNMIIAVPAEEVAVSRETRTGRKTRVPRRLLD